MTTTFDFEKVPMAIGDGAGADAYSGLFAGFADLDEDGQVYRINLLADFGPSNGVTLRQGPFFEALKDGLEHVYSDELSEVRAEIARQHTPDRIEHSTYWGRP